MASSIFAVLVLVVALVSSAPRAVLAACDPTAQPRLVLTAVSPGCASDPIAQGLSDFSLEILDALCTLRLANGTLPPAAATVRVRRRWDAGANIKRNAMDASFPFLGDDAYMDLLDRVAAIGPLGGVTVDAALGALFTALDGDAPWAVGPATGAPSSFVAMSGGTMCRLTYTVLFGDLDKYPKLATGAAEADVVVADGQFAELVTPPGLPPQYMAALCPAGTFANRSGTANRTIKTGCDPLPAGYASNGVGLASEAAAVRCRAGTIASEGAAMCLPCDVNMFAPFEGMPVCAECDQGFAPIQGSPRCFASFSGRVLVTEGQAMTGGKIYDPSGAITRIYGDDFNAVLASATFPAGFASFVSNDNLEDGVPALGGPLEGWAAVQFETPAAGGAANLTLDFLTMCVTPATPAAAVRISEDAASAMISVLGSTVCGRVNNKTQDLSTPPAGFTEGTATFKNLTLSFASPTELVAFGVPASTGTATVRVSFDAATATTTLTLLADTITPGVTVAATHSRRLTVLANSFGGFAAPVAPSCPAGTTFVEKGDSSGTTYSRQCLPCPDGSYCAAARRGFSPEPLTCPPGTRGTVFGATSANSCIPCAQGFFQDTPGSMECDACASAPQGSTMCPTVCPDGYQGDPRTGGGCTACLAGTYRFGDMPSCVTCGAGYEIFGLSDAPGSVNGIGAVDARTAIGGRDCKACPPGYFNDLTTTGACSPCAPGSYSPRGGGTECLFCPRGQYQPAGGAVSCKIAERGTYVDATGSAVPGKKCPAGMFGSTSGAGSLSAGCRKCEPGRVSSTPGSTSCELCKAGFYQDKSAQTLCRQCPAGSVNAAPGMDSCLICAPGSFSAKGSSTCSKCPVGTFQDRARQSGCKACPAGTFCPQQGMVAPVKCPPRTYGPRANGSSQRLACLPCATAASAGATKC